MSYRHRGESIIVTWYNFKQIVWSTFENDTQLFDILKTDRGGFIFHHTA